MLEKINVGLCASVFVPQPPRQDLWPLAQEAHWLGDRFSDLQAFCKRGWPMQQRSSSRTFGRWEEMQTCSSMDWGVLHSHLAWSRQSPYEICFSCWGCGGRHSCEWRRPSALPHGTLDLIETPEDVAIRLCHEKNRQNKQKLWKVKSYKKADLPGVSSQCPPVWLWEGCTLWHIMTMTGHSSVSSMQRILRTSGGEPKVIKPWSTFVAQHVKSAKSLLRDQQHAHQATIASMWRLRWTALRSEMLRAVASPPFP